MIKLGRYWPWKTVSSHLNKPVFSRLFTQMTTNFVRFVFKNRLEVYIRLIMVNISSSNFWCSVVISFIHFIPKVRKRDAEFASVNVKGVPLFNGSYTKGVPFLSKIVYKSGGGLDLGQSCSKSNFTEKPSRVACLAPQQRSKQAVITE